MSVKRQTATRSGQQSAPRLHECPECRSHLVQADAWAEAGTPGHWELWLRCPECDWTDTGVFDEAEIDRFDEELDRGMRELILLLEDLERSNMEEAVETFATALASDLILPEDF